ncbi:hypothetical protein ACFW6F_20655 [Streptomyces sp. NPDC058746]|uniref:hypothetical protein n=1 Tax=Streptomyces sp. NPDC058746 TaxID=3346622 RepID=UPI00367D46DA
MVELPGRITWQSLVDRAQERVVRRMPGLIQRLGQAPVQREVHGETTKRVQARVAPHLELGVLHLDQTGLGPLLHSRALQQLADRSEVGAAPLVVVVVSIDEYAARHRLTLHAAIDALVRCGLAAAMMGGVAETDAHRRVRGDLAGLRRLPR